MLSLPELAKKAVETYIKKDKIISDLQDVDLKFLKKRAGVFITIKKHNRLRGCIGTYFPIKENIVKEIIDNAISAATRDYRFEQIKKSELPYLTYEVSILGKLELVKELKELDPKKYGILIKSTGFKQGENPIFKSSRLLYQKTGLLLPDIKGIETIEQQVSIACQKAEIDPKKENIQIKRFLIEKYSS